MSRRRTRQSVPHEAHHDHLSGLPPELLELISECLSARDLLSWRLTCRATAVCSTRPFDRKYIAERAHFLLDEDSMLHLADLISDEERRRHLKTIHLSLAELLSPDADHRSRRVGAEVLGLDKGRGHRAKRRDQRALHTSLWNRLATGGRDRCAKMLEHCLRSLSSLRTEVGLSVTDVGFKVHRTPVAMNSHPEDPPAWGYESLCEKLGYREPLAKSQCDDGAWTVLFQAVRAAGFTPSTLELGNVWNGVPIDRMNKLWLKPSLRFEPFQQLTDLRLCLSLGFGSVLGLYEDARKTQLSQTKSFLKSFYNVLLDASLLRAVSLGIGDAPDDHECLGAAVFDMLFNSEEDTLMQLNALELDSHTINAFELLGYLRRRKGTLRLLKLRSILHRESEFINTLNGGPQQFEENAWGSFAIFCIIKESIPQCRVPVWENVYDGVQDCDGGYWRTTKRQEAVYY